MPYNCTVEGQYQLQGTLSVPSIRDSTIFSHIVKLLHGNVHKETSPSNIFTFKFAWKTEIGIQIASVALFAREAYRDKSLLMPCPIYKYSLHDTKDSKIYSSRFTDAIQFPLNYPNEALKLWYEASPNIFTCKEQTSAIDFQKQITSNCMKCETKVDTFHGKNQATQMYLN